MSAPMLTSAEQRSAARQLTLAMLALGLLVLDREALIQLQQGSKKRGLRVSRSKNFVVVL